MSRWYRINDYITLNTKYLKYVRSFSDKMILLRSEGDESEQGFDFDTKQERDRVFENINEVLLNG